MASEGTNIRFEPVFFKNSDVPQENNNWLGTWEICKACEFVVNDTDAENEIEKNYIEGAQKIGDLWRVYINDSTARVNLLLQGITLRGLHIELKDKNPFVIVGFEDYETTRLFIRNIPLSFDNSEIEKSLREKGVKMVNSMKYSRARDPNGKLTNFKTGDRFVDIIVPDDPLPKKLEMGIFIASLYHREQKQLNKDKECGNCMLKGHIRKECPNEMVCYECREAGHKRGDPECQALQRRFQDDDYLSTTSEIPNNGDEASSESENEAAGAKNVSQMISEVLTKEPDTPKPSIPKGDKQSLMTAFVASSLPPAQASNRAASPAGRRKMGDRSPDVDTVPHPKDKKSRRNQSKQHK